MPVTTHCARWIVPIDSPPIGNGRLTVENGRITAVECAAAPVAGEIDHGDAAILPGFVNAHTHLELTHLRGRVPFRGSFIRWVEDLVALRWLDQAEADRVAAIREGAGQSLAAGVTAIGDVGYGLHAVGAWSGADPWITGYLEVLGIGARASAWHAQSFDVLRKACNRAPFADHCRVGLSPHAPYSVETSVYRCVVEYAAAAHRPLCTHLAETLDELQFLADGTGPLRDMLERWGLWDGSFVPPGCSPVEYMRRLGLLDCNPLLIHVNYVSGQDLETLSRHDCHVAFCPRSHAFFGHKPHRWRDMLGSGINVCVGTDSLASNDSLSVLDELRFLWRQSPTVPPGTLLRMGTLAGARALGVEAMCGSLSLGKSADFVVLPLSVPGAKDPAADVLDAETTILAVYLRGQLV